MGGGVAGDSTPGLLPEAWSPEADARRSRSKGSQQPVRPHVRRGGDPRLQNAFKAALKGPRSVRRLRKKRAMFSISVAKYRPHRLHRLQCGSLQSFLAGEVAHMEPWSGCILGLQQPL